MIPFILIPLSIGMGLIGLGAFFWALERGQFDDPEGAASRILFTDARIDPGPRRNPPAASGAGGAATRQTEGDTGSPVC